MNFEYSTEADALYIELQASDQVAQTVEISGGCLVDLNGSGRPVGIELIHPARSWVALHSVLSQFGEALDPSQTAQLMAFPYPILVPRLTPTASAANVQVAQPPLPLASAS